MRHIKPLRLNESLTQKELADELKDAKYIVVEYNEKDHKWGVAYIKNGKKFEEGMFNTNAEVHNFLIDNGFDYMGKEGYIQMKSFRGKEVAKVPFQNYQKEILTKGLENIFDLD